MIIRYNGKSVKMKNRKNKIDVKTQQLARLLEALPLVTAPFERKRTTGNHKHKPMVILGL